MVAEVGCDGVERRRLLLKIMHVSSILSGLLLLPLIAAAETISVPSGGPKLFEIVAAEASGLAHVPKVHNENPLSYLYHSGFVLGGVAVGDLNGDGLPDLVFGGAAESNRVYRNKGDLKFVEITAATGLGFGDRWTTGVALADVDGDGDLDVHFCNYEHPNQLLLNMGSKDGVPTYKEVAEPAGIAIVDSSHSASFVDYDRDGDLDFFLLTNRVEDPAGAPGKENSPAEFDGTSWRLKPDKERYYALWKFDAKNAGVETIGRPDLLFRNDGVGADGVPKFVDVTVAAGIAGRGDGLSATWWDYDRDGWPDLFIGNDFLSEDRLWRNNGDGTFTNTLPKTAPHTCWFSMGADAGDLNNDLHPDFFLADMAATTHYKSKTTMGAMGGIDLTRAVNSTPPQYMRNTCLLGTGTGRFQEAAYLLGVASTDWTWAVKFCDFDHDGMLDIYITNGVIRAMNHSDRRIDENAKIGAHLWDFHKDDEPRPEQHRAYRNDGQLHFTDVSAAWGLDRTAVTYGCALGDFDRDGDMDIVECNLDEPPTLYRNTIKTSAEANAATLALRGRKLNTSALGAEVVLHPAGGAAPLLRQLFPSSGYHSDNEAILHFGLGKNVGPFLIEVRWPDGSASTHADLASGKHHVISQPENASKPAPAAPPAALFREVPSFANARHQELPYDDYTDQLLLPHSLSQLGPALAWCDVNGDDLPDFYLGGGAGQAGQLRLGQKGGDFKAAWVDAFHEDRAHEDMGAVFFDADRDGDADLFVASGSYQFKQGSPELEDRLYLGDGKGGFARAAAGTVPPAAHASGPVAIADIDRDGAMDVFIGGRVLPANYPASPQSRLLRNTSTKDKVAFSDITPTALTNDGKPLGMVSGAVFSDVNNDGWPDLLLAIEWGPVRLFLNDQKGNLIARADATDDLATRTGWWMSVQTADLDADGDLDILAGNFGYNTKYKEATPAKPKLLYFADFDDSGRRNIVEVKREGDVLFPERGRSCSSTAMPFIKDKFKTYHAFASATLKEVYGTRLDTAEKFEANTLGTGIFWNDGGASPTFRYEALDRIVQVAPVFGLSVADFTLDGHLDLFAAQNFHSAQIETGHYDGGLGQLMLGDGGGKFTPLSAARSGIAFHYDTKAATVIDLNQDGVPDLAVTSNNGPSAAWMNDAKPDAPLCNVRLPLAKAPGARLTIARPNKPPIVREYQAGSGYLGQSPAEFMLGALPAGTKITVRWPDGTTSERSVPAANATTVLTFD